METRFNQVAVVAVLALLTAHDPLAPATIVVDATCSLADAITAANTDTTAGGCTTGAGADEIALTADVTLVDALPAVASDIDIQGNGFSVSRDQTEEPFRIFEVQGSFDFALQNVTVSGGDAGTGRGGAVTLPGYTASLTLTNTTLSGNTAERGGAIYHYGPATLVGSTVSGNSAADGGGIWTQNSLRITEGSLVTGNQATGDGGGIHEFWYGSIRVYDSTISDNTAGGSGGGIFLEREQGSFDSSFVVIRNSTISGNSAGSDGGGVRLHGGAYGLGPMAIENSTFSANSAARGGAIFHSEGDYFSLAHSTLSGNSATTGGGLAVEGPPFSGAPRVDGTIIANSYAGGNCFGPLNGRENFDDDGSCDSATPITPGVDFDIQLSGNGGPTLTHALLPGSVAIDAAGDCGLLTDQRGLPRSDGDCDAGSFELGGPLLTLAGECPGVVDLRISGATADTVVELFKGPAEGSSQVPSGVCAGSPLGLTAPREAGQLVTDPFGDGSLVVNFPAPDCGRFLQAIDHATCLASTVEKIDSCHPLSLSHSGSGEDPVPTPASSPGCDPGEYLVGEVVTLEADPDQNWAVLGWSGTDDDASTSESNTVTMPAEPHAASVEYFFACNILNRKRVGEGTLPAVSPTSSPGCSSFHYFEGVVVSLIGATPDPGWAIDGWPGADDPTSTAPDNQVTMPGASHDVTVRYVEIAGPVVDIAGTCPGPVTVSVSTDAPNEPVFLFVGTGDGSSVVAGGACAGTELDLEAARLWKRVTTDGNGEATVEQTTTSGWCDRRLQAIDRTCSAGNVVEYP